MIQAMLLKKLADTVIKKVKDNRELKKIQEHETTTTIKTIKNVTNYNKKIEPTLFFINI